jgi:hypothetical protein
MRLSQLRDEIKVFKDRTIPKGYEFSQNCEQSRPQFHSYWCSHASNERKSGIETAVTWNSACTLVGKEQEENVMFSLFLVVIWFLAAEGQGKTRDEKLHGQMGVLHGTVTMLNHPQLGKYPYTGGNILFQRLDCEKAVFGMATGLDGKYTISLSAGKYRVFSRYPYGPMEGQTTDWLAPSQTRFVEVRPSDYLKFDIEVTFPGEEEMASVPDLLNGTNLLLT